MIILLVEDNPGDAVLMRSAFSELGSKMNLEIVGDGEQALARLCIDMDPATHSPDLPQMVLLDLNLPRLSGKEVLHAIRSDHWCQSLPVIVLSSSSAPDDVTDAYNLGANAYVVKPKDMVNYLAMARDINEFWLNRAELPSP